MNHELSNYELISMRSLLLILSILGATACMPKVTASLTEPDERGYIVQLGDKVPNIEMTFTNGETTTLKDLRGKVVVLQFTASWCGVCRKEMPHIEKEIWQPNKDKDLIIIGVDRDEPLEKALLLAEQTGITYPMALDPGAEIFAKFASKKSGVTRNVVIDRKGRIAFLTRLFDPVEFKAMKDKIEEIL